MMDEHTIAHIQRLREKQELIKKYEQEQTLKAFYEEVRQEKYKQQKLKKIFRIMVISFVLLITVMVANLQTLSSWEQQAMKWFIQFPKSFEHPFHFNLQ